MDGCAHACMHMVYRAHSICMPCTLSAYHALCLCVPLLHLCVPRTSSVCTMYLICVYHVPHLCVHVLHLCVPCTSSVCTTYLICVYHVLHLCTMYLICIRYPTCAIIRGVRTRCPHAVFAHGVRTAGIACAYFLGGTAAHFGNLIWNSRGSSMR